MNNLNSTQAAFVDRVVALKPRVATFDCDGTLWPGDAGEGFFSWELDRGLVAPEVARWARARYAEYKAGKVAEEIMCGEMVQIHRGLREEVVEQASVDYFDHGMVREIFLEMKELARRLLDQGCDVWAVSSTNVWTIRAAMRHFGIPNNRILAAETEVVGGVITDRLMQVPSGPGKSEAIRKALGSGPDSAFGNSIWDREMLAMAKSAFAINPTAELHDYALANRWIVYQPVGMPGKQ